MNWQSVENIVFQMFGFGFKALDSIDYYGITLLDFWLGLLIIGVICKLLIARAKADGSADRAYNRAKLRREAEREKSGE